MAFLLPRAGVTLRVQAGEEAPGLRENGRRPLVAVRGASVPPSASSRPVCPPKGAGPRDPHLWKPQNLRWSDWRELGGGCSPLFTP